MPNTTDTPAHTPAPWEVSKHATPDDIPQYGVYAESNHHRDLATVKGENAKANARLIAAAPDLLEACIEFVQHIESLPTDTEKCRVLKMALNNRAGDMILKAIAKATQE